MPFPFPLLRVIVTSALLGLAAGAHSQSTNTPSANAKLQAECRALDEQVAQLDAMARQPHSAATQDWIRAQRKAARDKQARLGC